MGKQQTPVSPGDAPGYPEKQPRDKDEAQKPHPRKRPNPDAGGLERDPEGDGKPGPS